MRIAAPLAILGFMSGRLAHADEWLGDAGFRVPDLGGDWRQPLYVPALPSALAWAVAIAMVASGLACSLGYKTRPSALVFAATLAFVAVSDRLAAFTVSKMSPAVVLAIAAGPAGTRLGLDARTRARRGGPPPRTLLPMGSVRFLQLLPVTIYSASGIAKARGDWLSVPLVLVVAPPRQLPDDDLRSRSRRRSPAGAGRSCRGSCWPSRCSRRSGSVCAQTRTYALVFGLGMHAMIGLCFGPVLWFALLMMTLLVGGYLPERFLEPLERLADRVEA